MAVVQIADIYNPVTFARRAQQAQLELNRFIQSGVAIEDPELTAQMSVGGHMGELTNMGKLAITEPNYSSDNSAALSTPANIAKELMKWRGAARNQSWSTMDLARELALQDPVGAITGRIGVFWKNDDEKRIINSLVGIVASNIANNSGDMCVTVGTDANSAVTDAERISGNTFIDVLQTLGDHKDAITTLAVHSVVHARLQKQNLIQFVRNSDNNIMFETYMGKRLIVDDSLPAIMGTYRMMYTCVAFGPGAIGRGNGRVLNPSEMQRKPDAGNGGGQDIIYSRVHNAWHPYGFSFTSTTLNGGDATCRFANYSDLKLAANWTRVWSRKNIPLAFIRVND